MFSTKTIRHRAVTSNGVLPEAFQRIAAFSIMVALLYDGSAGHIRIVAAIKNDVGASMLGD